KIVNQPRLEFDVSANHGYVFAGFCAQIPVMSERDKSHKGRGQWRAQLVTKRGEEAVLGVVRLLRDFLGKTQFLLGSLEREICDHQTNHGLIIERQGAGAELDRQRALVGTT